MTIYLFTLTQSALILQFNVPALLIQWEAILKPSKEDCLLAKGVCEAIDLWFKSNPAGCIIIIHDGSLPVGGNLIGSVFS